MLQYKVKSFKKESKNTQNKKHMKDPTSEEAAEILSQELFEVLRPRQQIQGSSLCLLQS